MKLDARNTWKPWKAKY